MPDNDQRDPLDSWLDQQVQPLPPPPGTFELISRRARRRKVRKLAVTVVSAAAVVAAAVIATPPLLSLNVKPTPLAGSAAGSQSSPTASGGEQPNGTATRYSPYSPKPTTPPSLAAPAYGPVPPNFQPVSVTFVSTSSAWVIGQAGTPGSCANKSNPYICTSIAFTNDAGKTWHGGPAPATTGPSGAQGVSGIRFLDGTSGWAFGPELWATHDAGKTWNQVDTHGARVTDLETAGDRAFALWATCPGGACDRIRRRLHQLHADDHDREQRQLDTSRQHDDRALLRGRRHVGGARAHVRDRVPAGPGRDAVLRPARRRVAEGGRDRVPSRCGPVERAARRGLPCPGELEHRGRRVRRGRRLPGVTRRPTAAQPGFRSR